MAIIHGRVVLFTANLKKLHGNEMTIFHQLGNDKNAYAEAVKKAGMKEGYYSYGGNVS